MGKHKKREKKSKKRKRPASSSSSSDSSSDSNYKKHKKHKKHHKIKKKERKDKIPKTSEETEKSTKKPSDSPESDNDYTVPLRLAESKRPETKEEYDKRQSIVRRVLDPETGRSRLIKGVYFILCGCEFLYPICN